MKAVPGAYGDPAPTYAPKPPEPAPAWPQSSAQDHLGVPRIPVHGDSSDGAARDNPAPRSDSVPAESTSKIIPEDEDSFRQYLRSLKEEGATERQKTQKDTPRRTISRF